MDKEVTLTRGHDGRFRDRYGQVVEIPAPPEKEDPGIPVRNRQSGDLGFKIMVNGQPMVRYDRPGDPSLRPFDPSAWTETRTSRSLHVIHVAMTCFAADLELSRHLAEARKAKEWDFLAHSEKMAWIGAVKAQDARIAALSGYRAKAFLAIVGALAPLLADEDRESL